VPTHAGSLPRPPDADAPLLLRRFGRFWISRSSPPQELPFSLRVCTARFVHEAVAYAASVKSGGTSHTMRCGMCIEIGKEQIPADLRNDDRNVAFHARHITGRRAEADEACWVLYVHVAQIPSAAGDLLEELMSGPKIRMRAEPVIHRILETGGFTVIMKPAQYETLARKTEQISRTIGLSARCAEVRGAQRDR
jgi:hypothetical protein